MVGIRIDWLYGDKGGLIVQAVMMQAFHILNTKYKVVDTYLSREDKNNIS